MLEMKLFDKGIDVSEDSRIDWSDPISYLASLEEVWEDTEAQTKVEKPIVEEKDEEKPEPPKAPPPGPKGTQSTSSKRKVSLEDIRNHDPTTATDEEKERYREWKGKVIKGEIE